jgi:lipid-binding SYLF domain-containing protein
VRLNSSTKINVIFSSILLLFLTIGTTATYAQDENYAKKEKKIAKQKKKIQKGKTKGLQELYKIEPSAKNKIARSYGYAVFTNTGVNLLVLSSASGKGLAIDNSTGEETYMKMISLGAGIGIGLKSYFGIFIFENKSGFDYFLDNGWSADGQADATADLGEDGISASTAMNIAPGVILYQIADKGFAAQATVQGTKFIVDDDLNN